MRQIILDTETTGLDPELGHKIIEIGAIVIQNREITQKTFHRYLNPERASDAKALAVHQLSQTFLQDKPLFSEIIDDFLSFLTLDGKKSEVIIHNAKFDVAFFNAEIKNYNALLSQNSKKASLYKPLEYYCNIVDSLELARSKRPNQKNNLDALCEHYGVDHSKRNIHGALSDAKLLAQVYLKMTSGQFSLFEALTAQTQSDKPLKSFSVASNLPTHYADERELEAHQNMLTMIRKSAGTCLWENE